MDRELTFEALQPAEPTLVWLAVYTAPTAGNGAYVHAGLREQGIPARILYDSGARMGLQRQPEPALSLCLASIFTARGLGCKSTSVPGEWKVSDRH